MPDRILRVRYRCKTESICTSRDISEICTWKNGTPYTSYRHKSIGSYRAGCIRKSGHCKVMKESTKNPVDIVYHIHICRIFIFLIFLFFISLKLFHRLLMYLHMQLSYSADKLCQIPEQWLCRNRKYYKQHNAFCGHSGNREQLRQENGTA